MNSIKTLIVDDHSLFRFGVRSVIENRHPDIEIVGEAATGAECFALLKTTAVDIVLLDIALPDISGIEIARQLKKERPELKILAISAENEAKTVEKMVEIGIEGFISKFNTTPDTLAEAIRTIMQDTEYFGKDMP